MKAAPAVLKTTIPSLEMKEDELIRVLESSIYPGATLESIKLAIGYCRANSLDPMQKPVHIVPMSVKIKGHNGQPDRYEKRDVIMPGIGLYRTNAARTDQYVGIDEAKFGPTATIKFGDTSIDYPEWCSVVVHRQVSELPRAFSSGKVYWLETYATAGNDTKAPNAMWKKRPFGQLEKCAEAMALRRAFPELGAAPTADELEGKTLEPEDLPSAPAIEGPRARPDAAAHPVDSIEAAGREAAGDAPGRVGGGAAGNNSGGQGPATGGGPKSATTRTSEELLNDTKKSLIRRALERAALSDLDLKTKYPDGIDSLTNSRFNEAQDWIKANAKT